MKARTFIIMIGAILALTASAAQANLDHMLPVKHALTVQHKVATHTKVVAHKVAKNKSTGPRYIHIPGPASQPSVYADDCLSSGNNCTNQQLCDVWGMNCDLATGTSTTLAAPAESTPDANSTGTAPSTDSAPTDNPTNDNSSASNESSALCPSGGVWDEDHEYCV